uniref:Tr-type G domain-containing protein n=1 Tax=Trichobilharzia regenti TaxID=157069 RepID=A0AA85JHR9_TRIRE|nr:unnamed protein product [Trichobilharzia regenti]
MASQDMDKAESVKIHLIEKYGVKNPDHLKTDISCKEIIPCLTPIEAHQLVIEVINFASLMSIREFVKRIIETHKKLDFLINNANTKSVKKYTTTNDGFEMTMGVNYFSSFLLTQLLLPLLLKGTSSRIINVCFRKHQHNHVSKPNLQMNQSNYRPVDAYYHSQLANIMYTLELSEYLKQTDIMVVSAHAGYFKGGNSKSFKAFINKIANFLITPIFPSQWEMAQTVLYTVLTDNLVSDKEENSTKLKNIASSQQSSSEKVNTAAPPSVVSSNNAARTGGCLVKEYLLRKKTALDNSVDVRVAVVGNADAGKSTLLDVLTHDEFDNGRGLARLRLLRHKHEAETGRTSSVAHDILGFNSVDQVVNKPMHSHLNWSEICEASAKVITFIDLAGHERYLKTTTFGMTGHAPDYVKFMFGANAGVIGMAKEHLGLTPALCVPVFVVVTKTDMYPPNVLHETMNSLFRILKSPGCRKISSTDDVFCCATNFTSEQLKPKACIEFIAEVLILRHPTTISVGYQAMVHAGPVHQTVTILKLNTHERLQFLYTGLRLIFCEGKTRAVGTVKQLVPYTAPIQQNLRTRILRMYPFKATQPTGTTEDTNIQSITNSTNREFPSTSISDLLNDNTSSSSNASKQRKHHRTRKEISNDTNSSGGDGGGTGTQQSAKSN